MLKHIVMWKFKDEAQGKSKEENIKYVVDSLLALQAVIPEIKLMELHRNSGTNDSNFDVVLITEFENSQALDTYKFHPDHQVISQYVGKSTVNRSCVDYLIQA